MRLSIVEASQLTFIHSLLHLFILSLRAISWAPGLVDIANGADSDLETPLPSRRVQAGGGGAEPEGRPVDL